MSQTITTRIVSDMLIVDLSRACFVEEALQKRIKELLAAGHRRFIVNLADLPYIDSARLGELVSILTSIKGRGGCMVLLKPGFQVVHVLEMTHVDKVIPIFHDEAKAIRHCQSMAVGSEPLN